VKLDVKCIRRKNLLRSCIQQIYFLHFLPTSYDCCELVHPISRGNRSMKQITTYRRVYTNESTLLFGLRFLQHKVNLIPCTVPNGFPCISLNPISIPCWSTELLHFRPVVTFNASLEHLFGNKCCCATFTVELYFSHVSFTHLFVLSFFLRMHIGMCLIF